MSDSGGGGGISRAELFERGATGAAVMAGVGALAAAPAHAGEQTGGARGGRKSRLVIEEQGARAFAGTILGDFATASIHCDHGYVEWQIPPNARTLPLLMWHSSSTKTWETTFDGRDGYKNIFLRRGFPIYLIDPPRIGRAGWGGKEWTYTPDIGRDQRQVSTWRLGTWTPPAPPEFFPNVQFPTDDPEALDQLFRGRYPEFDDPESVDLESGAVASLLDEIGPAVVLTHSGSGIRGWATAIKSPNVSAVVAYEGSDYIFPEGEAPAGASTVPLADFRKLTRIPIQVVFGDNVDQVPSWSESLANARAFVELVNRYGGDAEVLHLPEVGIFGNTHFPMSDLNNAEVADLLSEYLKEKRLDRRRRD